jgi:hypothetical protein
MARTLHIHPSVLDFWLIAVYCEFDMRGNMQGSRNIMLQALRRNPGISIFYFEYIKYELRVLKKLHTRKKLLETNEAMTVIEEQEENKKEDAKMSESVPSIVYATSTQSITKQFKTDVDLHFRIRELVKSFESIIDVSQLLDYVNEHIDNILYTECKSEVISYLLENRKEQGVSDIVNLFLSKTTPDIESFQVLIKTLTSSQEDSKTKYEIALKFYNSISSYECPDQDSNVEKSAIKLLEFIDLLDNESFDMKQILNDLHAKYPNSFPILVHFCKNALLHEEFEDSQILEHREYLSKLTAAIKKKQNSTLCKPLIVNFIAQTEKYYIRTPTFLTLSFLSKARLTILQYFNHSHNENFLLKTLEYSIKETVSHLGVGEGIKLLKEYIDTVLLRRQLDSKYCHYCCKFNIYLVPSKAEHQIKTISKLIE